MCVSLAARLNQTNTSAIFLLPQFLKISSALINQSKCNLIPINDIWLQIDRTNVKKGNLIKLCGYIYSQKHISREQMKCSTMEIIQR